MKERKTRRILAALLIVNLMLTLGIIGFMVWERQSPRQEIAAQALTTGIAAILLLAIFFKRLCRVTDRKLLLQSFLLAMLMTGDLLAEKAGLETLPSSNASFMASLNILFVPILLLFFHQKPTRNNLAGTVNILLGLLITSNFRLEGFYNRGTLCMVAGTDFLNHHRKERGK